MKFIKTYIKEGMFERTIDWSEHLNLVFSNSNTKGKTTLLRILLYSIGYPIPNTKNIKFEMCLFKTELECHLGIILITRDSDYLSVAYDNKEEKFILPNEMNDFHKLIWKTDNTDILDNILGAFYVDQEKGWTMLNRGKPIGNIHFNIEQLIRGLSDRNCSDLIYQERKLSNELKKYKQMMNIAQYQDEINDIKDNLVYDTYEENVRKELDVLNFDYARVSKELKRIDKVIKDNDAFSKYIEDMKIRVKTSSGEEIPVNRNTLVDFDEYEQLLYAKRKMIISEMSSLKRKIDKLSLEIPQENHQLSFDKTESILQEFNRNISRFNIEASTVNNIIIKLEKEHARLTEAITETTKRDNIVVDEIYKTIFEYVKELGLEEHFNLKINYLFTRNLKELSGAILHKMVFAFRLAYIKAIEKKLKIKLPIIIDSPSGKEVDAENVNTMLKILKRDFSENQIILASIYSYGLKDAKIVEIEGKLINQVIE